MMPRVRGGASLEMYDEFFAESTRKSIDVQMGYTESRASDAIARRFSAFITSFPSTVNNAAMRA